MNTQILFEARFTQQRGDKDLDHQIPEMTLNKSGTVGQATVGVWLKTWGLLTTYEHVNTR